MKIVVPEKEIKVDDLSDLFSTNDKSKTMTIGSGSKKNEGRGKELDPLTKELMAIDGAAGNARQSDIALIYGTTQEAVSQRSHGMNTSGPNASVDEDLKETTDRVRHKIENAAVSKLMSTLELFEPEGLENQMEVVTAATKLASVVEKIKGGRDKNTTNVQVVMYQPRMREVKDYEVLEVTS